MSWCWRASALPALSALAFAAPAPAQSISEVQLWGTAVASRPAFYGAGLGFAWRDGERDRYAAALAVGGPGPGALGLRADFSYQFLLDPARRAGAALYGGGGLSLVTRRGGVVPYLLLVLGVEHAPGGSGGSFVEIGVGGGARIAVGYRWRKRSAPGR